MQGSLHHVLEHLNSPTTNAHILFIAYGSAFNTIIPHNLFSKLRSLRANTQMFG